MFFFSFLLVFFFGNNENNTDMAFRCQFISIWYAIQLSESFRGSIMCERPGIMLNVGKYFRKTKKLTWCCLLLWYGYVLLTKRLCFFFCSNVDKHFPIYRCPTQRGWKRISNNVYWPVIQNVCIHKVPSAKVSVIIVGKLSSSVVTKPIARMSNKIVLIAFRIVQIIIKNENKKHFTHKIDIKYFSREKNPLNSASASVNAHPPIYLSINQFVRKEVV